MGEAFAATRPETNSVRQQFASVPGKAQLAHVQLYNNRRICYNKTSLFMDVFS